MAAPPALAAHNADRHAKKTAAARRAIQTLDRRGAPISFAAVAELAGVARQWLYTQPELKAEIERLRAAQDGRGLPQPSAQRATEASLRRRLDALLEDNRRLRADNQRLRRELELALGEARARAS